MGWVNMPVDTATPLNPVGDSGLKTAVAMVVTAPKCGGGDRGRGAVRCGHRQIRGRIAGGLVRFGMGS